MAVPTDAAASAPTVTPAPTIKIYIKYTPDAADPPANWYLEVYLVWPRSCRLIDFTFLILKPGELARSQWDEVLAGKKEFAATWGSFGGEMRLNAPGAETYCTLGIRQRPNGVWFSREIIVGDLTAALVRSTELGLTFTHGGPVAPKYKNEEP